VETTPQTMIAAGNNGNDSSDDGRMTNGMIENDGITVQQVFACGLPFVSWLVGASQSGSVDIAPSFIQNVRWKGNYFSFFTCDYLPALLLPKL
jgi:hypothetical protein